MSGQTAASDATERPETILGLFVSLLFWLCLFCSALLFAAVGLSPKFLTYLQLRNQYDTNQAKLVRLEQQGDRLQQLVDAIKHDPNFAAELTRIEFDAVRPGEEVIPVESDLKLDARALDQPIVSPRQVIVWYQPTVQYLASDHSFRTSLLWSAALLVTISFWILQPADLISSSDRRGNSVWQNLRNRYIREAK